MVDSKQNCPNPLQAWSWHSREGGQAGKRAKPLVCQDAVAHQGKESRAGETQLWGEDELTEVGGQQASLRGAHSRSAASQGRALLPRAGLRSSGEQGASAH